MARLIVEEGGNRRAFKVGDGVLTIGTGAEANLKVSAPDVAEIHAEIQITGGQAVLRARPGVVPPTVDGQAVQGESPVAYGASMQVGSVQLWLEDENQAPGTSPAPAAAAPAAAAPASSPAAQAGRAGAQASTGAERAARRQRAMADAKKRGDRSVVQRSRPRVQRGLPTGAVIGIVLAIAVVGGFAGWKMFKAEASGPPPTAATLSDAEGMIARGSYKDARAKLDGLRDLKGEDEARRKELLAELDVLAAQAEKGRINSIGTKFFDTKLVKYESMYLQGAPSKPRARVFLKRCQVFKTRWPDHHERDWVERQEKRFQGFVSLGDPPTLADVEWEVECLTKTNPKYFGDAFAEIDAFLETASGFDLEAAQGLRNELVEARKVEFDDRIQQAKYLFHKKKQEAESFAELVYIITRFGEESMENEAATMLVDFPNLKGKLEGWREMRPLDYELLIKHPMVAKAARDAGL